MSKARVLVIDDDATVLWTLTRMLERLGYDSSGVSDGRDGLRLLENDSFDLVITDLFMPEQDGIETIQRIREIDPGIPILAISDSERGEYSALDDAKLLGADAGLSKPFGPDELLAAVRRLLEDHEDERVSGE